MSETISPHQRLEAQIRLARRAVHKAEGRWLAELTPQRADKLARRRAELTELIAQRRTPITVPGDWRA